MVPYVFWICFFRFHKNDINILIGVAMNLYLAFGVSVEMSTVLSLQSIGMICFMSPHSLDSLSECGV